MLSTKTLVAAGSLVLILLLESVKPLFPITDRRWRHIARNAAITLISSAVVYVLFSSVTPEVFAHARGQGWGMLGFLQLADGARSIVVFVLFDGWM